jgi:2-keto-4-pentenoate hydratase
VTAAVWEDARVARGLQTLLDRQREETGRRIGWKVGLGGAAAMERLGTTGPLVAPLTDATLFESGDGVSIGACVRPCFEPEIAAHIGADLHAGADLDTVRAAIAAIGPAIELVDLPSPPADPEEVLAGGFAHRAVLFGPSEAGRAGGDASGLGVLVETEDGEVLAETDDPLAAIGGDVVAVVRHVADFLGPFGEHVRKGETIITGSTVQPPPEVHADQRIRFELRGIGEVAVALTE